MERNEENILKRNERDEHDGLNISKLAILGIKSAVVFNKWINENLFINIPSNTKITDVMDTI